MPIDQEGAPQERTPEEIAEIEKSRTVSDKEIIEEGAEVKEGELKIADRQWEHFHKEMELELTAREKEDGIVGYIKDHIESDLSFQPEIRQDVAKTLLALLKLSRDRDEKEYIIDSTVLLARLEQVAGLKTKRGFASTMESIKAAANFGRLNDGQRTEIEKYIQDQIEKKEQTLNRFMAEKFGLQSRESYDPDAYDDPESKMVAATLAMFSSGRLEDFSIDLAAGQEKQDEEITSAIEEYYKNQGYEIEMGTWDNMFVTKGEQSLMVVFTNYGDSIQVSVQDMKNL